MKRLFCIIILLTLFSYIIAMDDYENSMKPTLRYSYAKLYDFNKYYNKNWGLEISSFNDSNAWIRGKLQYSIFSLRRHENYIYQYQCGTQTITDTTIVYKRLIIPSINVGIQIQKLRFSKFNFFPYITIGWYPVNVNLSYDITYREGLDEINWWISNSWSICPGFDFDIKLNESWGINIGYEDIIKLSKLKEKKNYEIPLKNLHFSAIKFTIIVDLNDLWDFFIF